MSLPRLTPGSLAQPALIMRGVRKVFARGLARAAGRTSALTDVDLTLCYGELLCLAGPESSGKTALLQCAAGLLKRDAGEISWFGERHVGDLPVAGVAYVPAVPVYYPFLTVRDVVEMRAARNFTRGLSRSCRETLSAFELDRRLTLRISDLSRDELRRVAIAEALVAQPLAVLVDTAPSEAAAMSRSTLAGLRAFSEMGGAAMIAVRDTVLVAEAATRIVVLDEGVVKRTFYWDAPTPTGVSRSQPPLVLAETLH